MGTRARAAWLLSGLSVLLLAATCGSNTASEDPEPSASPPAGAATATPTDTPEPTSSATPSPGNLLDIVYVGNTGGDGVSLRDACRDDARIPGAWAEGTAVRIIDPGEGECAGWTFVAGPGKGSWVSDGYLTETKPAVASPPSSSGGSTPPSGTPPPSGGAAMFVFGTASPGAFIVVFAGGHFCDSTLADSAVGIWGLEVGAGTECSPATGAPLSFSVNGAVVPTAAAHTYVPGGQASVDLLNH